MTSHDLAHTDPQSLADMMVVGDDSEVWRDEDLSKVFAHLLGLTLEKVIGGAGPKVARLLDEQAAPDDRQRTIRDVLEDEHPKPELLDLIKRYAKAASKDAARPLPADVARTLYVLSIAAAMARTPRRNTKLRDEEVHRGIRWVLNRTWLNDSMRVQLKGALNVIDPGSTHAGPGT